MEHAHTYHLFAVAPEHRHGIRDDRVGGGMMDLAMRGGEWVLVLANVRTNLVRTMAGIGFSDPTIFEGETD